MKEFFLHNRISVEKWIFAYFQENKKTKNILTCFITYKILQNKNVQVQ